MKEKCVNGQRASIKPPKMAAHSTQLGTVLVGRYITVAYCECKRFCVPWVSGFGKGRWLQDAQWKGRK